MSRLVIERDVAGNHPGFPSRSARALNPSFITLAALLVMMGFYAFFFGWLSLSRYWAYEMHALDMGNMAQAAWNTVHGHPFFFTNMRLPYDIEAWNTTTRLSFHVEAIFPLISLVYVVSARPESLLILQTIALTLGVIPAYLLARDILQSRVLALTFPLAYLLSPSLEALNLYEFHPVSLATPLLLCAFLFARRRQYVPFVVFSLLAMGTKEQIGLVIAMMGLYIALTSDDRGIGLRVAGGGTLWSLFAALIVERHFRHAGTKSYLHTRYGYLGHGLHGVVHTLLHDPGIITSVVFTWPKLGYLEHLLAPVGFLAVLAPLELLLGAPTFALNLLSSDFHMYTGAGDNSAELVAVVTIAGIFGARTISKVLGLLLAPRHASILIAVVVLVSALWEQNLRGYTPAGAMYHEPVIGFHQKIANQFVAMIPASVPVSTQDQLDPHLSNRQYLYLLEDTGRPPDPPAPPANYILLDVSAPTYPLPSYQLHDYAWQWIHRPGWGVAAARDGLILIKKGARTRHIPPSFFSYARADNVTPGHALYYRTSGLDLLGYDAVKTDLANHRIPNLAYTFYIRTTRHEKRDMQPVLYETMNGRLIGCASDALGLKWLPTSHWQRGAVYTVRLNPLETNWSIPGTAALSVELRPVVTNPRTDTCAHLWSTRRVLAAAGSLAIQF